jgi:hypothetical protein
VYVSVDKDGTVKFKPRSLTVPAGCQMAIVFLAGADTKLSGVTAGGSAVQPTFMYLDTNTNTGSNPSVEVRISGSNANGTSANPHTFTITKNSGDPTSGYGAPPLTPNNPYAGAQYVYVNFQYNDGKPTFSFVPATTTKGATATYDSLVWLLDPKSSPGASLVGISMGLGSESAAPGTIPWSGTEPQMTFIALDSNPVPSGGAAVTYGYTCQVMYGGVMYTSQDPEVENEAPPT